MKHRTIFIAILISLIFAIVCHTQQGDIPILKGPYLGQKPPGMTPELFAPGIITTDASEGCSGWGKDMEYFIFQRRIDEKRLLYIMNQNSGVWSAPELLPFSEKYQVGDFTVAPDGKTMVFASRIPIDEIGSEIERVNIWSVEKTKAGWTEPEHIGLEINTKYHESYPCLAANGNLYFFSRRPGGYGDSDLYMSQFSRGKFQSPVNLGPKLNTEYHEWDTYIAPDESYMIYCSTMPGGLGDDDLYVTFKQQDGSWSEPVHMGAEINTDKSENRPYVSTDGKYFFYTSTVRGNRDIYWVDAKIIKKLKPVLKGSYLGQKPPGMIPEIFAPGIISTDANEGSSGFLRNGTLFVFSQSLSATDKREIFITEMKSGTWTQPEPAPFISIYSAGDFTVAPDGRTLYFTSRRSLDEKDGESDSSNIWVTEIAGGGWSKPRPLEYPVNTEYSDAYPSVTQDGTIYFFSRRPGGLGGSDIYRSRLINGKYTEAENLGPIINTGEQEWDPFIAADESFLVFCSTKAGGYGRDDLYVAFRNEDGSWMKPVNMGENFNSSGLDNRPYITPDGKYFFYVNAKSGNRDIYWVNAKIIEALRPRK